MRGGIPVVLGLIITLWCGGLWLSWSRASHWPQVRGTLISADLREERYQDSDNHEKTSYVAHVRYRYSVKGREYLGIRYAVGHWNEHWHSELARVNTVRQQQAEQGSLPVYYNPHRPGDSALDVRVSPFAFLGLNAGLVLLSLGLTSAFPGRETPFYHKITTGTFLSAALLGAPYALFGWGVNTFLVVAWIILLVLPFTGFGAPKPFRSAGRRK